MQRQCDNALELARFLQSLGGDIEVNYPGLEESPYHEIAKKQFRNGYGAIVTVRTGSKEKAFSIINSLKIPLIIQYRRYEDPGDPSGIHHRGTHLR